MNVAVDDMIGIGKNCLDLICKDDLHLSAAGADQIAVVFHVVNACKFVLVRAEQLTVTLQREDVAVRIDAGSIDLVQAYQLVTHLVGGVAEHQDDLLGAHSDSTQTNCKAVAGEDGENHTNGSSAQFCLYIGGNAFYRCIISLCSCNDRLGDGNDVSVADFESLVLCCLQNAVRYNGCEIVTLADDGASNSSGNRPDSACIVLHVFSSFLSEDPSG